ncbi:MAG: hypothetical protein HZB16_07165 [Armatimonadetes bacterium]|nr:hypothetical protein [Armatimonadota bacterium]
MFIAPRALSLVLLLLAPLAAQPNRTLTVDAGAERGLARPVTGFLGGLRDSTPDELLRPMNIGLWRIGHQFRGRIGGGLNAAIDRVESLGARYKLVMSDLIASKPTDWAVYEADVKKLVASVGPRAKTVIWEPVNEPDISHKPIETYYDLYEHAFRALRAAEPEAQICGPGYAFPNHDRYRQFLDACRARGVECNYLAWHYTGWDPRQPERGKWGLERLHEFIAAYPEQKIREIHCDEWGAGPEKPNAEAPGRLLPGLAVNWFQCLEEVYRVDRACRANWGKEDDYLGGIVTDKHEPHPSYQVYRLYGQQKGMTRIAVEGTRPGLAALAAKDKEHVEVLIGSVGPTPGPLEVVFHHVALEAPSVSVYLIPADDVNGVLTADRIPLLPAKVAASMGTVTVTLPGISQNQAYHLVVRGR